MARPLNGAVLCAYFKRIPNHLGDDINTDFGSPIYFHGRFREVKRRFQGMGVMQMATSSTVIDTMDLDLKNSEMKKDDVIETCEVGENGSIIIDGGRIWRVVSHTCDLTRLRVYGRSQEDNERLSPKILEVS